MIEEFYAYPKDRHELRNLALEPEHAVALASYRQRLLAEVQRTGEAFADKLPPPRIYPEPKATHPPNVVLILADDLGYADLGCQGSSDVVTPHSIRWPQTAYDAPPRTSQPPSAVPRPPASSPAATSRGLVTRPIRPEYLPTYGLPEAKQTLADVLREAGYRTGMIGKWDLGTAAPFQPQRRGFDDFCGFYTGCRNYVPLSPADPATFDAPSAGYGPDRKRPWSRP